MTRSHAYEGPPRIAAAYCRCSTDDQEASPEVQRAIIEKFARANHYIIPESLWFVDEGVSASKEIQRRPDGKRLLAQVMERRTRPFETIIIKDLDRAFRDVADQELTFRLLVKYDCPIIGAKQDLSRETAMQRAMLSVQGIFAQAERELTGERIREHNAKRHDDGLHSHGCPATGLKIGATSSDPLQIDEGELQIVLRVFELYAETAGRARAVARLLNAEGLRTRHGMRWSGNQVLTIVRGAYYRRSSWYGGVLRSKPDIIPETVPADLLARVDRILETQQGHWSATPPGGYRTPRARSTYSGLAVCGACGSPLDGDFGTKKNAARFRCRKLGSTTAETPCKGHYHAPTVDALIGEAIRQRLQIIEKSIPRGKNGTHLRRTDRSADLKRLKESRQRALDAYVDGDMTKEQWAAKRSTLDAKIAALEANPEGAALDVVRPAQASETLSRWDLLWSAGLWSMGKRELLTATFGVAPGGIVVQSIPEDGQTAKRIRVTITAPALQGAAGYALPMVLESPVMRRDPRFADVWKFGDGGFERQ